MKSIRCSAFWGAILGAALCAAPAHSQQAPDPDDAGQFAHYDPDAAPADGLDVRGYVSDRLDPAEAQYVRREVNKLPRSAREKIRTLDSSQVFITIYDAGTKVAHYNRPELAGTLKFEPDFALPGDDYPKELLNDNSAAYPAVDLSALSSDCPSSPPPGCYAGSGPYRRIYTKRVPPAPVCPSGISRPCPKKYTSDGDGYYNTGKVTIGCDAGEFVQSKTIGEAGFVYLGGWSPTGSSDGGIVDAGLQYNYEISPESKDDYSLFIKLAGVGTYISTSSKPPSYPQPSHIECNNTKTVSLEFRVKPWERNLSATATNGCKTGKGIGNPWQLPGCATFALIAQQGVGSDYSDFHVIVWVAPNISYGGWGRIASSLQVKQTQYWPQTPCPGCVFKWMTSIGQKNTNGKKENLTDGAYFTSTWSSRGIAPYAQSGPNKLDSGLPNPITASLVFCSEYPVWTTYNATTIKSDCKNSPSNLKGLSDIVRVFDYSPTGEQDIFDLLPED